MKQFFDWLENFLVDQLSNLSLNTKFAIEIIVLGILGIVGLMWQIRLVKKDTRRIRFHLPKRIVLPVQIGIAALVGLLIYGIMANWVDERSTYEWRSVFRDMGKLFVLFFSFTIKSYLGPIFVAVSLIMFSYFLFEYGEFRAWHFVEAFFDWAFSNMPQWMESIYYFVLYAVAISGSVRDGSDAG